MSIAHERFQVIDEYTGVVVHEAASREDAVGFICHSHPDASLLKLGETDHPRSMRFLVRHPRRILTVVPRGVAFRVISR